MKDKPIQFVIGYFNIGDTYSVTSEYENAFVGKVIDLDDNISPKTVTFETVYGALKITAEMAVTQNYRFEKLKGE